MKINCFWNNCYQMAGLSTAGLHAPLQTCKAQHAVQPVQLRAKTFSASNFRRAVLHIVLATHGQTAKRSQKVSKSKVPKEKQEA